MTENALKALKIINDHGGMKAVCADPAFYACKRALRKAFPKSGIQLTNSRLAIDNGHDAVIKI